MSEASRLIVGAKTVCLSKKAQGKMKRQTLASKCDDLELQLYHHASLIASCHLSTHVIIHLYS